MLRTLVMARARREADVAPVLPTVGAALLAALMVFPAYRVVAADVSTLPMQAPSQPVGDPLTLDAALRAAQRFSQALPAQAAAAQAARERAVAAGQRPDPVLRFGLDNVPIEGGTDHLLTREPTTARSIGFVQALPDRAKREARAHRFEQDAHVAEARRQAVRAVLRRETALAWLQAWGELKRLGLDRRATARGGSRPDGSQTPLTARAAARRPTCSSPA